MAELRSDLEGRADIAPRRLMPAMQPAGDYNMVAIDSRDAEHAMEGPLEHR